MEPSLPGGSFVLILKLGLFPGFLRRKALNLAVIRKWPLLVDHPRLGAIIKQCLRYCPSSQSMTLVGTHPYSTSTESMGLVDEQQAQGIVLFILATARGPGKAQATARS